VVPANKVESMPARACARMRRRIAPCFNGRSRSDLQAFCGKSSLC
jgi:hypothetical protein